MNHFPHTAQGLFFAIGSLLTRAATGPLQAGVLTPKYKKPFDAPADFARDKTDDATESVDPDLRRRQAGPTDQHGVTRSNVQVRRRLLRDEDTARRASQGADRAGEGGGVAGRQTKDDSGTGRLR